MTDHTRDADIGHEPRALWRAYRRGLWLLAADWLWWPLAAAAAIAVALPFAGMLDQHPQLSRVVMLATTAAEMVDPLLLTLALLALTTPWPTPRGGAQPRYAALLRYLPLAYLLLSGVSVGYGLALAGLLEPVRWISAVLPPTLTGMTIAVNVLVPLPLALLLVRIARGVGRPRLGREMYAVAGLIIGQGVLGMVAIAASMVMGERQLLGAWGEWLMWSQLAYAAVWRIWGTTVLLRLMRGVDLAMALAPDRPLPPYHPLPLRGLGRRTATALRYHGPAD